MTLEEARSVMWLRNNHRPLGELLDEGFLDQRRLEWAAAKAYDPKLKQAAAVLLDWMKQPPAAPAQQEPIAPAPPHKESLPAVDAGVTVEQARATTWPFRPFKGQAMGNLVDTRQLTIKDLGFAIETAWDESVRRAAIVLTALRLNQVVKEPPPPAGPLKVVSAGRSYAERKQSFLTMIEGLVLGGMLGVSILYLIQWLIKPKTAQSNQALPETLASPEGMIALVIVTVFFIGVACLILVLPNLTVKRLERQIESYRKGQEGEDRVVEVMRQNLDGNWTLFRNVTLPGRNKADIDAVLVGPPGVWALEVKTFTGEYRNIGEHWEYRTGNRWGLLKSSPSHQANDNAIRLGNFFKADGIKQWVTAAVVWANRESPLAVENPMVAVWTLDRLPEELGNIWQGQETEEAIRTRIVEKLTMLCQRDEEAN